MTYDQAKQLDNFIEYDALVIAFIRIKDGRDPLDLHIMDKFNGYYTLVPASAPLVLFEDAMELFKLNLIQANIDDGFSISRYWNLIQLEFQNRNQ